MCREHTSAAQPCVNIAFFKKYQEDLNLPWATYMLCWGVVILSVLVAGRRRQG